MQCDGPPRVSELLLQELSNIYGSLLLPFHTKYLDET